MSCHKVGGVAPSNVRWTVAGTVYKSDGTAQTNAIVKLFDHLTNTLNTCIKTNSLGNFYTTQAITGLTNPGVDPVVVGPAGERSMTTPAMTGSCNSCHTGKAGQTPRIIAD